MRIVIFLFVLIYFSYCSSAEIKGIDLFGSDRLTVEQIIDIDPNSFKLFFDSLEAEDDNEEMRKVLEEKIKHQFSLPYARLSTITYLEEQKKAIYITFDVVEECDVEQRLCFLDHPEGIFEDPENLIATWDNYMNSGVSLLLAGEIPSEMTKCSAFHSIFGHQHPQLAPFEKIFVAGSAKNKNRLIEIFFNDRDEHHRADAVFLLAYLTDGQELVHILTKRMRDPSAEVRNNIMRVFACIAIDHPEISLPVEEIVMALNFPNTTDRNKAAATLYGLLSHEPFFSQHAKTILATCSEILHKMQQLKQPNNSKWAYQILKKITGNDPPIF